MKVAVLGHGVVGRRACEIIENAKDLELKWILELPDYATEPKMCSDLQTILDDPEVDVVADILPGTHPSYEYMKRALAAGKHVVTVNKAALCFGFEELMRLAEENGVTIRYEASCGGTIPDIAEAIKLSRTNEITSLYGIMNGTTNYIIDKMNTEGADFEPTLREAQSLGYAEKDPSADLSGFDVKNKLVILSATAYRGYCISDIPMFGIEKINRDILDNFRAQGKTVKLFGISVREEDRYAMAVLPVVLPLHDLEANVPRNFNLFTLNGSNCGTVKLYGQGAGGLPTADAVVRDIFAIRDTAEGIDGSYFVNELQYDPSLLRGKGYIDGMFYEGTAAELCAKAHSEGKFLAFETKLI